MVIHVYTTYSDFLRSLLFIVASLQDDQWTKWHYAFAVGSPIPMGVLLLLAAAGWSGFYDLKFGELPVLAFVVMLGKHN